MPDNEVKLWTVFMREAWVQPVTVRAPTLKEAVSIVQGGEGQYSTTDEGLGYAHTMPIDTWTACDESGEYYYDDLDTL